MASGLSHDDSKTNDYILDLLYISQYSLTSFSHQGDFSYSPVQESSDWALHKLVVVDLHHPLTIYNI